MAPSRPLSATELGGGDLLDSLDLFLGTLSLDGVLIEANRAVLAAAGVDADAVVGLPLWDTPWWSWDDSVRELMREAVARGVGGHASRFDVEVAMADGELLEVDFHLVPVREGAGTVSRLCFSAVDISHRKQHERDLARLTEIESGHRRAAEAMFKTAEALARCATVDDIATCIVELAGDVVGATFANIAVAIEDAQVLEIWHGDGLAAGIEDRWPRIALDGSTPLGHAVLHGEPVWLGSPAAIREAFPSGADDSAAAGLVALAAMPIPHTTAALGFAWSEAPGDRQPLVGRLSTIAQMCGQAIERARLYERERRVAAELQRSMLPETLPSSKGFDVAARYLPGDDSLQVGGDWYDVGRLGSNRYVVAVGDIVGRGLVAAASMGRLRTAFSALTLDARTLDRLIERVEDYAVEDQHTRFSTMLAVELNTDTGKIAIANAGHVPAMIRRANGEVDTLYGTEPPLGLASDARRVIRPDQLDSGDSLILYTDGLVERRDESIDKGLARLAEVLAAVPATSALALCDAVIEQLGAEQPDDIALLVVRF